MQNITFRLTDLHQHGEAFFDFLRLRKRFFVDGLGWEIPHDNDLEMDQYDNPTAYYSVVVRDGKVIGGARTMPTDARWGEHTYMLRDAYEGKLGAIPPDVMIERVTTSRVWECTRLVVSDELTTQAERSECLWLIVNGLVHEAEMNGAEKMISLSPLTLVRALRQLGFSAERIGEPYRNDHDGRRYAVLSMPAVSATSIPAVAAAAKAAATGGAHHGRPALVHAPSV